MIVAISYAFHDYEPRLLVIDTRLLDTGNAFERSLKQQLEGRRSYVQIGGEQFEDDWGDIGKAIVQLPIEIDAEICPCGV